MDIFNNDIKSKLSKLKSPLYFNKKKIIKELGIDFLIRNYNDIQLKYFIFNSYSFLIKMIFKYDLEDFINYVKNANTNEIILLNLVFFPKYNFSSNTIKKEYQDYYISILPESQFIDIYSRRDNFNIDINKYYLEHKDGVNKYLLSLAKGDIDYFIRKINRDLPEEVFKYIFNNYSFQYGSFKKLIDHMYEIDSTNNIKYILKYSNYLETYLNKKIEKNELLYIFDSFGLYNDLLNRKIEYILNSKLEKIVKYEDILKIFNDNNTRPDLFRKMYNTSLHSLIDKVYYNEVKNKEFLINSINIFMPEELLENSIKLLGKDKLLELLNDQEFLNKPNVTRVFCSKLYIKYILKNINEEKYLELIKCCKYSDEFIKSLDIILEVLRTLNINEDEFYQYSLNTNYNFVKDFKIIYEDLNNFKKVYDYFNIHIYNINSFNKYDKLFNLTKNYIRYKELCLNILNKDLTKEQIKNITLLFNKSNYLENIKKLEDLNNFNDNEINNYKQSINNEDDINIIKSIILTMLFNKSRYEMEDIIKKYGNYSYLKLLEFNNKSNKLVLNKISLLKEYVLLIENILDCDNIDTLKKFSYNILNDYYNIIKRFDTKDIEELYRDMYSLELNTNLTKIDSNDEKIVKDIKLSKKYDIDVYDFRDKKYMLCAHVKSNNENIEDLIYGRSTGKSNFISLSAIGYRKQSYYYDGRNIILGYDEINPDNFRYSSIRNMGSNYSINNNTSEIGTLYIKERGILDLTNSDTNSEILCFRSGLKPKYIIIPEGKEITKEIIDICKKYDLKIVLTQKTENGINSPKEINEVKENYLEQEKEQLLDLREQLIERKNKKRKIAVFTDIHGLYEPALAILCDIKKQGIDEIYSLGDNIGTGPNSKEVINLLKEFNVKSIKGNHELYQIIGVDPFKEHFDRIGPKVYEEALENANYIKSNINSKDLEEIKSYGDQIELDINGKKILLTHYIKDYNTGKYTINRKNYDLILQGHTHFQSKDKEVFTLRGVGIGMINKDDIKEAYYITIEETEEGFEIKEHYIEYDYESLLNSINLKEFNTKEKIKSWI